MDLIRPMSIPLIDAEWMENEGVTEEALIRRAGACVAKEIASLYTGGEIVILAGGGNNGADGYATALSLHEQGIIAHVADVFEKGQRSEGGKAVLADYRALYGEPLTRAALYKKSPEFLVDAMLGSGAVGPLSDEARRIGKWLARQRGKKIAIDIPLGVDADFGEVQGEALQADVTIVLSLPKRGLFSYPAKGYCGKLVFADLGLRPETMSAYFAATATDAAYVKARLPRRSENSHKGSFGKVQLFSGSRKYRGAPHLTALGALRMGVGLLRLSTVEEVMRPVGRKIPELLMDTVPPMTEWTEAALEENIAKCEDASAVIVGPGCGVSEVLYRFVDRLVHKEGAPLLLDADALGAIAAYAPGVDAFFASAKRPLALTPHPLEFARLIGMTVAQVQAQRMRLAMLYAQRWGVSLLLKGAGTLICDGHDQIINTTGSSALSKGGSGDVLSGAVGAFLAQGCQPLDALAIAAYLHGAAGDSLASELSEYGVLPSDLPYRMARVLAQILAQP